MANKTKLTLQRRRAFLAALSTTASVSKAAQQIGMARTYLYVVRDADPTFKAEWDSAVEEGTDQLEDEAVRRAFEGWEEPVYHQGIQCGTIRRYSDGLLTMLLKARRPDKYRERTSTELTGKDGAQLGVEVTFV